MVRIAGFAYDKARWIIIVTLLLTILAMASVYRFELEADFMSMFSTGNPEAQEYNYLNAKYQNGEPVSILIEDETSLLTRENLVGLLGLQEEVRSVRGISGVQSFIPPEIPVEGQAIPVDEEFIECNYELVVDFVRNGYYVADWTLSKDEHQGILAASLASDVPGGEAVEALQAFVVDHDGYEMSLAGDEVVTEMLGDSIITVMLYAPPFALLLILLVFLAVIRNLKFTLLALTPAGIAIAWSYGTMLWGGQKMDVVTSVAPLFVLILGTMYGLHYVSHYIDNIGSGYRDRRVLTVETMRMVGIPILLATITTIFGFAALTWTEIIPIRSLGIYSAVGIAYAGLLTLFFLPALVSRVKVPARVSPVKDTRFTRAVIAASGHRALIVVMFLALAGASIFYILRLEISSDQLMWFKEDSDTRRVYDTIAEDFGGAFPLTAEISAEQGSLALMDSEFAGEILALEREMEEVPGVESAFSIFDLVKVVNLMMTGQDVYPEDPMVLASLQSSSTGTQELATWVAPDGLRMLVRAGELTPDAIAQLDTFVAEHEEISMITGTPMIFNEVNTQVTQSQIRSLALAFGLILIVLLVTLRSLRAAVAGLLPIVITVLGILGFLAASGTNLNILTAFLSSICIGVGIDYCIHIISGIHYFRRLGQGNQESVRSALSVVAGPVLANALGIAVGFSILFLAPLKLYTDVAAVLVVAMVLSAMGALLLIPVFYSGRGGPGSNDTVPIGELAGAGPNGADDAMEQL